MKRCSEMALFFDAVVVRRSRQQSSYSNLFMGSATRLICQFNTLIFHNVSKCQLISEKLQPFLTLFALLIRRSSEVISKNNTTKHGKTPRWKRSKDFFSPKENKYFQVADIPTKRQLIIRSNCFKHH